MSEPVELHSEKPHEAAAEWSDSLVASMRLGGVEEIFFVSGSELAFLQEAIAKAEALGEPAPRLLTMVHENVALNAAIGVSMVTGRPSASAAHVDAGTLHFGAAIHTAWRGSHPIMMIAGAAPRAASGSMRGSRDAAFQAIQEPRNQAEIVRQYTKADHHLEHRDDPGLVVSRLLQVARSEPRGPVYLTIPRETAMLPLTDRRPAPTADELGIARPTWPDPEDARQIARWLIDSRKPCIYPGHAGNDPQAVDALVSLAELLALPVEEAAPSRLNFPRSHYLYGVGPSTAEADVLLIIENETINLGGRTAPNDAARVVWIGADPVLSRVKLPGIQASLSIPATAANVVRSIHEAALKMLTLEDHDRIERRRERLRERQEKMLAREARKGRETSSAPAPSGRQVAYELSRLIDDNTIVLNDAVSSARYVDMYLKQSRPRSYFRSGSSGGGWGPGAALGAKLAAPERDVILVSGDGFFMFGEPLAALWAASYHRAPFLSVVLVNGTYHTGITGPQTGYPGGYAAREDRFEGGRFDPAPDFGKLAEAAGAYGETVSETGQVGGALCRGLEAVRNGRAAVIAVRVGP